MEYEIIVGPPAYSEMDYPDQPIEPAPSPHNHAVTLLVAITVALTILGALMWWIGGLPNNIAAPVVPTSTRTTKTVESLAPPVTKWVVPDLPDVQPVLSVDERFIATLARHGVGPAPGVDKQTMIDGAHGICSMIAAGWTQQQVVDALVENQIKVTPLKAKMIVVTAVDLYCHP